MKKNGILKAIRKFKTFVYQQQLQDLVVGAYISFPLPLDKPFVDLEKSVLDKLILSDNKVLLTTKQLFSDFHEKDHFSQAINFWQPILNCLDDERAMNFSGLYRINAESGINCNKVPPEDFNAWIDELLVLKHLMRNHVMLKKIAALKRAFNKVSENAKQVLESHRLKSQQYQRSLSQDTMMQNSELLKNATDFTSGQTPSTKNNFLSNFPLYKLFFNPKVQPSAAPQAPCNFYKKLDELVYSRYQYQSISMEETDSYYIIMQRDKLLSMKGCLDNINLDLTQKIESIVEKAINCYEDNNEIKEPYQDIEHLLNQIINCDGMQLKEIDCQICNKLRELADKEVKFSVAPRQKTR